MAGLESANVVPVPLAEARRPVSPDLVAAVDELYSRVLRGEVIGVAWLEIRPGRGYEASVAGVCQDEPAFARGVLGGLDDKLGQLMGTK